MPEPAAASQELARVITGPPFVGWCTQIFFSGICLHKALPHLSSKSKLGKWLKRAVALVTIVNLGVSGLCYYGVFYWGTIQKRDIDTLSSYTLPDACVPTLFAIVALVVQGYFAQRAWRVVNRSYIFLVYIAICMAACCTGGIGYTVWAGTNRSWVGLFVWTELYAGGGLLTDLSISIVLMIGLYRQKTGLETPTDSIATRLARLSFETAAMTAVFTGVGAAVALATAQYDSRNTFLAILFPTPSVYVYSLLYCLDRLEVVRSDMEVVDEAPSGVLRHVNVVNLPVLAKEKTDAHAGSEVDQFDIAFTRSDLRNFERMHSYGKESSAASASGTEEIAVIQ